MPERIILPNEILLSRAEQTVSEGKVAIIPVKGQSMFPFIHGDRDRVELYPPTNLAKGDVVLARLKSNKYILHRIIRFDGEKGVVLMGDGNRHEKEYCYIEDIKAKALTIVSPKGGRRRLDSASMKLSSQIWNFCLPIRGFLLRILWLIYF